MNPKIDLSEAAALSAYFDLRRLRPPGWLALYFPRSDGDFEFVAMFDMANREDAFRMLRAVIRASHDDLIIVSAGEPDEPIILTAPGAVRALSVADWSRMYRQFDARMEAFTMQGKPPVFSENYRKLHEHAFQELKDKPDEE